MNLILDLVILLVILLSVWSGKRNGFIKSFFGFFGSIAAFVLASLLARPAGAFLSEQFIRPAMDQYFVNALSERIGTAAENLDFSTLPESCNDILSRFGVSVESLKDMVANETVTAGESALETVSRLVIEPISDSIGYAVSYIVLFIVLAIVIRIVVKALDLVAKLPVLNFSNKTLGIVMGAVCGIFLAIVFSGAVMYLEPVLQGSENPFLSAFEVDRTYLLHFFSKIDLLGLFSAK